MDEQQLVMYKRIAKEGGAQNEAEATLLLDHAEKLGLIERGRNQDGATTVRATPLGHVMWTALDRVRRFEEAQDMLRQVAEMLPGIVMAESDRLKETSH